MLHAQPLGTAHSSSLPLGSFFCGRLSNTWLSRNGHLFISNPSLPNQTTITHSETVHFPLQTARLADFLGLVLLTVYFLS
jgi:hypothetical protein